jgi:hypothetical protein
MTPIHFEETMGMDITISIMTIILTDIGRDGGFFMTCLTEDRAISFSPSTYASGNPMARSFNQRGCYELSGVQHTAIDNGTIWRLLSPMQWHLDQRPILYRNTDKGNPPEQ